MKKKANMKNSNLNYSENEYYTVAEYCKEIKVSRRTFYNMVADGRVEPVKIFGRTLIKKTA